jgi:hypothetical protein
MLKRLLLFSSICLPVAIFAIAGSLPPVTQIYMQPCQMRSAETHVISAALRRAQPNFKPTPRTNWLTDHRLYYGYDHVVAAAKPALYDKGIVVWQQHVPEPRPMILTYVEHPESKQFVVSAKIVPQHPHHSTPTQSQYNQAAVSAYVEAVGLEVPLDQLIEGAQEAAPSNAAQN